MVDEASFNQEQQSILSLVDHMKPNKPGWTKYYGDVVCRIVAYHLQRHLPGNLKVIGPNAYVEGFPTEFDLVVVDGDAAPFHLTAAYPSDRVCCVVEVKTIGVVGNFDECREKLARIKRNFDDVQQANPRVKCAYLTVQEGQPAREKSFDYVKATREKFGTGAFILRNSRGKMPFKGEWERFVGFATAR